MQPQPVRRRIFFNEFFARGCVFKLERWKQPQVRAGIQPNPKPKKKP